MAVKNYTKSRKDFTGSDDDDYQKERDAQTLKDHAELTSDPDRLQKAIMHLKTQRDTMNQAHGNARRALYQKTGKRMKQVFGSEAASDKTPFEEAENE